MTTKEQIIQALEELPDDSSYEDALYRLYVLSRIERGIRQAEAGETLSNEEVKERFRRWLR